MPAEKQLNTPKPKKNTFEAFQNISLSDEEALLQHSLHPDVVTNAKLFSSMKKDIFDNFGCAAISPFSGKKLYPVTHFGIDSDPWMHSVLYSDNGKEFIVVCQGLTHHSLLGSIIIPKQKLFLNNHEGWYYSGAFRSRIERNLPRILNYFHYIKRKPVDPVKKNELRINFAIGNNRVGDFIMQLLLLNELLTYDDPVKKIQIENVFVNRESEFMEVELLFPELKQVIKKLPSFAHIEYHTRHYPGILFSDVRVLTNKVQLRAVQDRISNWLNKETKRTDLPEEILKIKNCDFSIWIALELEKRVWAEQEEGLVNIIKSLSEQLVGKNGTFGIVFNGLTSCVNYPMNSGLQGIINKERVIFERMKKLLPSNVHMCFAGGMNLSDKMILGHYTDFVCAPIGSASIVPSLLLNKPGIVYAYDAQDRASFAGPNSSMFDNSQMIAMNDLKAEVAFDTANQSYSFNWQDLMVKLEEEFIFDKNKQRVSVRKTQLSN
jgi:hypothetical protein